MASLGINKLTETQCRVANKPPTQDPNPCISFLQEGEAPPRQVSKPQGQNSSQLQGTGTGEGGGLWGSLLLSKLVTRDWKMAADPYSCWVLLFHLEPLSLGKLCEIFIFSHSLGLFLWKFDTPVEVEIHPMDAAVGVKIHPANHSPLPVLGRSVPPGQLT